MPSMSLSQALERLQARYGEPAPPEYSDPWRLILWENVAYLADDGRRREAMEALERRVGLGPEQILAAQRKTLKEVASHGILADTFAEKLRRSAQIALESFDGDLRAAL